MTKASRLPTLIFLIFIFSTSCRSAPTDFYTVNNPIHFKGCEHEGQIKPSARSYAAMLEALTELKWTIDETKPEMDLITATACLGASRGTECVTMLFNFTQQGTVAAHTHPDTPVKRKMDGHVVRWKRYLEQRFSTYRCLPEAKAQEILARHGFQILGDG